MAIFNSSKGHDSVNSQGWVKKRLNFSGISWLNNLQLKTNNFIVVLVISTYVRWVLTVLNFTFIGGIQVLKPLGDRVILQAQEEEETTVGGIVLASNAQEKPQTAKVIAVGEGRVLIMVKRLRQSLKKATLSCLINTPVLKWSTRTRLTWSFTKRILSQSSTNPVFKTLNLN